MRNKKNKYFILFLIFILISVFIHYFSNYKESNIIKHKKILLCKITGVDFFPRGSGFWINFSFFYNNKLYKSREHVYIDKYNREELKKIIIKKKLIIVFDSTDISNIEIPIKDYEFEKFNIKIPNSLKSIYNEINKN